MTGAIPATPPRAGLRQALRGLTKYRTHTWTSINMAMGNQHNAKKINVPAGGTVVSYRRHSHATPQAAAQPTTKYATNDSMRLLRPHKSIQRLNQIWNDE